MIFQSAVGSVSRHLPRGRGTIAAWLRRHPGPPEVRYRDHLGLARHADLRDEIESRWFAGVDDGIPGWVLELVEPTDWVIDVGANVGTTTGQLARAVRHGRVWACEPVPRNVQRLRELREDNDLDRLDVLDVAVGAEDGRATLRLPGDGESGWASFTASWVDSGEMEVEVRSLDSLVGQHGMPGRLSLMKLDVEGYEAEVIAGAAKLIHDQRPRLFMEVNHIILSDRGRSGADLIDAVLALGYRIHERSEAGLHDARTGMANLLFVPA